MLFWSAAAALVAVVAFPLLRALTLKPEASRAADFDVQFYRHQQLEIERQREAGQLAPAEAQLALAEAGRRLLAVKAATTAPVADGGRGRRLAQVLVLLSLPLVALPVYLLQGRPDLPAQPHAARADIDRSGEDLSRLIGRLDAHLADSPDDARGYELAFPVYMRLGRYDSAVTAAERLIALKGETPARLAALAEALIFHGRGVVGEQALAATDKALAGDPKLARARFYKGLAAEQAGRPEEARALWQALADDLPDGAEKAAVADHLARLGQVKSEPSAADAIRAMPEVERQQAIRGMVEGLAARLKQDGGTLAEWQRLIRAHAVLGEKARASEALSAARAALKGPGDATAIEGLARELGLSTEAKP